jgi:ribonucleoside-diphosphate reductase alpha chain
MPLKNIPDYVPTGLADTIFKSRYASHQEETFAECCRRTANLVASAEKGSDVAKWSDEFYEILRTNLFCPGGRIIAGGKNLANCFVRDSNDSIEGLGTLAHDLIVISGRGGGLGINMSNMRPRGSSIRGSGGTSTGSVALMKILNGVGGELKASGGRRAACLFGLHVNHGDIVEFLDVKLDRKELNNANISVIFNEDPEDFFELVKHNKPLELKFHGTTIGEIPAKEIWDRIVKNALLSGEPGVLNSYLANRMSNIYYYKDLCCTNPCFSGDTLIHTKEGHVQIKDLVGKKAHIWNGEDWQEVDNFRVTGTNQAMLEIELLDGVKLRVTPYHNMLLKDGTPTLARDIEVGMRLMPSTAPGAKKVNTKVFSVKEDGVDEKVYCCTVPGSHSLSLSCGLTVGQCAELFLTDGESCCLGSIVLPRFIKEKAVEWPLLAHTVKTAVRFLDNVLSVNRFPLPLIAEATLKLRRVGLGVMGLHDALLLLGLKYNSDAGLELVDKIMGFIKNTVYLASSELAKEKGSFEVFDSDKFLRGGHAKTLKPSVRTAVKQNGLRNCALMTMPPTGTTSMLSNVTSGIEPMFAPAYIRRFRLDDEQKEEIVIHPMFKQHVREGKSVKHFQGAHDLSMRDHLEMQRVVQRHVDGACSKSINIPQGTSPKEYSDLLMEYLPELKGLTVYPDGSRENQPLEPLDMDSAIAFAKSDKAVERAHAQTTCKDGKCDA